MATPANMVERRTALSFTLLRENSLEDSLCADRRRRRERGTEEEIKQLQPHIWGTPRGGGELNSHKNHLLHRPAGGRRVRTDGRGEGGVFRRGLSN